MVEKLILTIDKGDPSTVSSLCYQLFVQDLTYTAKQVGQDAERTKRDIVALPSSLEVDADKLMQE